MPFETSHTVSISTVNTKRKPALSHRSQNLVQAVGATTRWVAVILILLTPVTAFATGDSPHRPNIVLIMADDMGFECVGANGCLDYQTPHLDALAADGLRFEHCYSQPICTPSRVKLMTGKSNQRNYVRFGLLDRSQTTFAHLLQAAGYRTCIAGKWQLGSEPDAPQHFGFEQSLLWQHTRGRTDAQKHDTRYPNPKLDRNGQPEDYDDGEFSSDLFAEFIEQFMEDNRDQPFLVYYPMCLVHCPFCPTPNSDDWDAASRGSTSYKGSPQYFGEMVRHVDHTVQRLTGKLDDLGLRDNTLLIFTGDNGTDVPIVTQTTWGRVAGAKGQMTDGGNHVACIVSWPDVIRKGRITQDIIDFSDFLPTLCDAAGARLPDDLVLDGRSFLPQIRGERGSPRDSIYMWYTRNGIVEKAQVFARNQRYKLYRNNRFFDIHHDRLEQRPLSAETLTPDQQAVKALLQRKIDSFANVVPPQKQNPSMRKRKRKD